MSLNTHPCPVCNGEGSTLAFVCGPAAGSVRSLLCRTCYGKGWLDDAERAAYNEQKAKHAQRRAARVAQDLSMREMAKKLGVKASVYADYEHGRIDEFE